MKNITLYVVRICGALYIGVNGAMTPHKNVLHKTKNKYVQEEEELTKNIVFVVYVQIAYNKQHLIYNQN